MSPTDLLRFSAGALTGHRLRTALSVLGVAIGVASVIMLTSLGEGARLYVTGEFASLGSTLLIVLPGKAETTGGMPPMGDAANDLTLEDARAIRERVRGVQRVSPLALGATNARFGEKSRDVTLIGTTRSFRDIRSLTLAAGSFLPEGELNHDERVCVLGATIRQELFGPANPLGEQIRVGGYRFRVIGSLTPFGTGIGGNMDEMVFVPAATAMRMLNRTSLFRIFVEIDSVERVDETRRELIALLKTRHDQTEDVTIFTQQAMLSTFDKILSVLTYALAGIAAISLSVAGIGIMNVMLVSVSERTREVGLMKALGATYRQIVALFLAEAAILSSLGGVVGLGVGLAAGRVLREFYPDFPAQPPEWAVVSAVLVSVAVGVIFGAIPARRAARLDPIASLARR